MYTFAVWHWMTFAVIIAAFRLLSELVTSLLRVSEVDNTFSQVHKHFLSGSYIHISVIITLYLGKSSVTFVTILTDKSDIMRTYLGQQCCFGPASIDIFIIGITRF